MPMKIASTKKAIPSSANGKPMTSPYCDIRPGHSRPISKLRIVPETAPTANSTAATFDHRRASESAIGSFERRPRRWATKISAGNATPKHDNTMWNPSDSAIWYRAASNWSANTIGNVPPSVGEGPVGQAPEVGHHLWRFRRGHASLGQQHAGQSGVGIAVPNSPRAAGPTEAVRNVFF